MAEQDDEQEQGPAGMGEAAAAPPQAPHHARAAPIKFEGELEHLNWLLKEDQQKARRRPGVRAAEFERRGEHHKDDPIKLSKHCMQAQESKRCKQDQEEAEAGSEDKAG